MCPRGQCSGRYLQIWSLKHVFQYITTVYVGYGTLLQGWIADGPKSLPGGVGEVRRRETKKMHLQMMPWGECVKTSKKKIERK